MANAELVSAAVRSRLEDKLTGWTVYARSEVAILASDKFPCAYCVLGTESILSVDTDNREEVGYPVMVVLMIKKPALLATDLTTLPATRRLAQQAVDTTNWSGLLTNVESVDITNGVSVSLADLEANVACTGFTVILGLLEDREALP